MNKNSMTIKEILTKYDVVRSYDSPCIHLYEKNGSNAAGHILGDDLIGYMAIKTGNDLESIKDFDIKITSPVDYEEELKKDSN